MLLWLSIFSGGISAICWFGSAVITPDLSASYYGGPPKRIKQRTQIGSLLNGAGALFASIAMGVQAAATYYSAAA
jgi:hypothetical protein